MEKIIDAESAWKCAQRIFSDSVLLTAVRLVLDKAPTIDAEEVVRCKDCACFEETHRTVGEETGKVYCSGYCYHWDYEQGMSPNQVDGDDFCSHGERRAEHGKTD